MLPPWFGPPEGSPVAGRPSLPKIYRRLFPVMGRGLIMHAWIPGQEIGKDDWIEVDWGSTKEKIHE
jgi:hypothetical protein